MVNFILPPMGQIPTIPAAGAQAATTSPPDLGTRAVTAPAKGKMLRHDPGGSPAPPLPAKPPPAPIKGLGVDPLDTRQVGDRDRPSALDLRR